MFKIEKLYIFQDVKLACWYSATKLKTWNIYQLVLNFNCQENCIGASLGFKDTEQFSKM